MDFILLTVQSRKQAELSSSDTSLGSLEGQGTISLAATNRTQKLRPIWMEWFTAPTETRCFFLVLKSNKDVFVEYRSEHEGHFIRKKGRERERWGGLEGVWGEPQDFYTPGGLMCAAEICQAHCRRLVQDPNLNFNPAWNLLCQLASTFLTCLHISAIYFSPAWFRHTSSLTLLISFFIFLLITRGGKFHRGVQWLCLFSIYSLRFKRKICSLLYTSLHFSAK